MALTPTLEANQGFDIFSGQNGNGEGSFLSDEELFRYFDYPSDESVPSYVANAATVGHLSDCSQVLPQVPAVSHQETQDANVTTTAAIATPLRKDTSTTDTASVSSEATVPGHEIVEVVQRRQNNPVKDYYFVQCSCGKGYRGKTAKLARSNWTRHVREGKASKIKCERCPKRSARRSNLHKHYHNCHSNTGWCPHCTKPLYTCNGCHRGFANLDDYNAHILKCPRATNAQMQPRFILPHMPTQ